MTKTKQINNIINEIRILDYYGKLEILEKVVTLLRNSDIGELKNGHSLRELKGLGKEVWENVNINEYIEKERNSWN